MTPPNAKNLDGFIDLVGFIIDIARNNDDIISPYLNINYNETSLEPGDKLQMGYKSIMRTDE